MYKNKVSIQKRESITTIPDSMIPVDFCQNNSPIIIFITNYMTSKFELFSGNKMNNQHLTEIILTYWLQMFDEYWEERDTT